MVEVAYKADNSGPGQAVYAHRNHAPIVQPEHAVLNQLSRRRKARKP